MLGQPFNSILQNSKLQHPFPPPHTHLIFYAEPKRRALSYGEQESGKMVTNAPLHGRIRRDLAIREISSNAHLI